MVCKLCILLWRWVGANRKFDPDSLFEKSHEWERVHSNLAEIADRENDPDLVHRVLAIYRSDPQEGFRIWLEHAEQGSVWCMRDVAACYARGSGVPRDHALAEHWFRRAADAGSQMAMLDAAGCAARRRDFSACEQILKPGLEQGWPPAFYRSALYRLRQSADRAVYRDVRPLLEYAISQGHPAAKHELARGMMSGKFGFRHIRNGFRMMIEVGSYADKTVTEPVAESA